MKEGIKERCRNMRSKNMMYEQQIEYLPEKIRNIKEFSQHLEKKLHPHKYAIVLHDKDKNSDGTLVAPHIHAMLCFKNARSIANIAKLIGDKPQYIEKWSNDANNGFAYLCHRTSSAAAKYQYEPSSIIANFDYSALIEEIEKKIAAKNKRVRIEILLDALYEGEITRDELERAIHGSQYGKYAPQIERIYAKRLRILAEEWRKKATAEQKTVRMIWIYGNAGVGKSSLAKEYARKTGEPYFVSGSSRDIFQRYEGQHTIILDELRPGVLPYHDFLRLTDPYGIENEVMAPARYADKAIACDLFIITTPYDPRSFYHAEFPAESVSVDKFAQLQRRITLVIHMTDDNIYRTMWDGRKYSDEPKSAQDNSYSAKHRPGQQTPIEDLYQEFIKQ